MTIDGDGQQVRQVQTFRYEGSEQPAYEAQRHRGEKAPSRTAEERPAYPAADPCDGDENDNADE